MKIRAAGQVFINRALVASGGNGGTFKAVASGEKLYGMVVDFVPIRAKAKGSPVEFVFPPIEARAR